MSKNTSTKSQFQILPPLTIYLHAKNQNDSPLSSEWKEENGVTSIHSAPFEIVCFEINFNILRYT